MEITENVRLEAEANILKAIQQQFLMLKNLQDKSTTHSQHAEHPGRPRLNTFIILQLDMGGQA
jgi:hypothetical protein